MALFFSRRSYNASTGKFTKNLATLTRYVTLDVTSGGGGTGGIVSQSNWLDLVAQESDTGEVLIYVHGFNTNQSDMLVRHAKIETALKAAGYRGAVVAFDWPSQGVVTAYDPDRHMSEKVAGYLVPEGIRPILQTVANARVHLLGHSMGAYLSLLALAAEGETAGETPWKVDEALFVAADVEASSLRHGAWGALVMEHRARRLTNYYNVADKVLSLSGSFVNFGAPRAGQVGLPNAEPANAVDVYTTEQFRRHVPQNKQNDLIFSHIWLYDDAGFQRDMALTVMGTADAQMPTRVDTNVGDRALLT